MFTGLNNNTFVAVPVHSSSDNSKHYRVVRADGTSVVITTIINNGQYIKDSAVSAVVTVRLNGL